MSCKNLISPTSLEHYNALVMPARRSAVLFRSVHDVIVRGISYHSNSSRTGRLQALHLTNKHVLIFASRCFESESDASARCTCFDQTCIITVAWREPLASHLCIFLRNIGMALAYRIDLYLVWSYRREKAERWAFLIFICWAAVLQQLLCVWE